MKIAIIGAGIIGRLLSWRLLRYSTNQISLYDKEYKNINNCSMTAAGILSPFSELDKLDSTILNLSINSLNLWDSYLKELKKPIFFQKNGSIITAHQQDIDTLSHYIKYIEKYTKNKIQILTKQELKKLEPNLNMKYAYWLPKEGQIDSQAFMNYMGELLPKYINWYEKIEIKYCIPHEVNGKQYDWVIDCRGLGAKEELSELRSIRGELIWIHTSDISFMRPIRMIHPKKSIYIVPRPKNIFILGSSEIESYDFSPISVRTTLELLSSAYSVNSSFLEARIIKTATQCRPTLPNYSSNLIIHKNGLIRVNGLFRYGWLVAPPIVEKIIQHIFK